MKEEADRRAGGKDAGQAGGRAVGKGAGQTGGRTAVGRSAEAAVRKPAQPLVGDQLKLRKKHPCGGEKFEVVRTGMDIRLQCLTCGSQIVLSRRKLEKMTAGKVTAGRDAH